jgi:hypothetical protein
MVKSILCLLQRSHVSWNRVKGLRPMAGFFFFLFSFFFVSQVSALDVAWTILVVSQIFSYRQLVWRLVSTFFISLTTADKFCVHTYTWNATRSMCCLNAASDGGSFTREESFDNANFTLSVFRSLWTDLVLPFGSYRSDRFRLSVFKTCLQLCKFQFGF